MGGNLVSNPNQVLSSSELATRGANLILKILLNPTSRRDAPRPCLINNWSKEWCTIVCVISLGQVLIRQRWEVFLPYVGLSKTLKIRPTPRAANSEKDNT